MLRPEYPRPGLVREPWINLNGTWKFAFDDQNIGLTEKWYTVGFDIPMEIEVPFAYQTKLSGIADPSFHDWVWYQREFTVPDDWDSKRVILNFGAVDYRAWVYVNGQLVGSHEGGETPFSFDITDQLTKGTETLVVRVEDPSTDETIPRGKQFWEEESAGIWYTRTTGIWQTVWLEAVSSTYVRKVWFTPDVDKGDVSIEVELAGDYVGKRIETEVSFQGKQVGRQSSIAQDVSTKYGMNIFGKKIFRTEYHHPGWTWTPETPNLFDVTIQVFDGATLLDEVNSYFGMRKVHTKNGIVFLNNRPYYQKLVLDQGYWPDGLLTAPSDDALKRDIELAKEMGFNGCRKHQKVEDPRFLYWADKLGYLVWGECASFASYSTDAVARLTAEWSEIIDRDYNHPCIITWVPINESWGVPNISISRQQQHHSQAMYHYLHSIDPTRLVISNDGWEMTETDILALHNYNHGQKDEVDKYRFFSETLATETALVNSFAAGRFVYAGDHRHRGAPIILTEFGGIGFQVGGDAGWGYTSVANATEFLDDYRRVMKAVFASKALVGFCYTQLTDVEQEINGLLTYDRKPKCDLGKILQVNDSYHTSALVEHTLD